MAWVTDPKSVSFSSIRSDLMTYLQSKSDYLRWKDFYNSSAGQVLIELIAGMGAMLQHKAVVGRRETFLPYMQNRSSAVARAEAGGYSCDRGKNVHLTFSITPNVTTSLSKYDVVGTVKDADIMLLDNYVLNAGVPMIISVVIGNLLYEDLVVPDSELQIFRFSDPYVTEDIQLQKGLYLTPGDPTTFNGSILNTSELIIDLLNNKYITLTNTLDAVDVMYLNNNSSDPYYYNTGDILRLYYIKAYDLTFQFTDLTFSYGTIHGYVYNGTTVWAPTTAYTTIDYVTPTLVANNSRNVRPYLFNNVIGGTSNGVGEPYWYTTVGLYTADISIPTPPTWTGPGTAFIVGDLVLPTVLNGYYYKVLSTAGGGVTGGVEPIWPVVVGSGVPSQVIDNPGANQIVWGCYNLMDYDMVTNTPIAYDLKYQVGYDYVAGDIITPTTQNGYYYTCAAPGGLATAPEPSPWGTVVGGNTADSGGFNWICALSCAWNCNNADVRDNNFIDVETLDEIKVNAPLHYESQFTVRARDDFMKIFKGLDSRMSDTNYQDITPAVVELTYVRTDAPTTFTNLQKQAFINTMNPHKALGIPDPLISDPSQIDFTLNFNVYMKYAGSYPTLSGIADIMSPYNLKFKNTLGRIDIFDIERQVEDLVYNNIEYVKKCVITINAPVWTPGTVYRRGDFVTPATPPVAGGYYIYECVRAGTSGMAEPGAWPIIISEDNIDDVAVGTAGVDVLDNGTLYWRCRQQVDTTTLGYTSTYNFLSSVSWKEYYSFLTNITIIPA